MASFHSSSHSPNTVSLQVWIIFPTEDFHTVTSETHPTKAFHHVLISIRAFNIMRERSSGYLGATPQQRQSNEGAWDYQKPTRPFQKLKEELNMRGLREDKEEGKCPGLSLDRVPWYRHGHQCPMLFPEKGNGYGLDSSPPPPPGIVSTMIRWEKL